MSLGRAQKSSPFPLEEEEWMHEWAGEPCEGLTVGQIVLLLSGQHPLAAAPPSALTEPRPPGNSPLAFAFHSG